MRLPRRSGQGAGRAGRWRGTVIRPRALFAPLVLAFVAGLPACAPYLPAKVPMPTLAYPAGAERARILVVFLPGIRDRARDFERQEFVKLLRAHKVAADVVAADAHLNYYLKGVFRERLERDVIQPALSQGYEEIWLVGVSLGGFGALRYAQTHSDQITGVVALAPYLGEPEQVPGRKTNAGGGKVENEAEKRSGRRLPVAEVWAWLDAMRERAPEQPKVYLGYGRSDKFASQCAHMAKKLPPERVVTLPGRHRWATWRRLWKAMLGKGPSSPWAADSAG